MEGINKTDQENMEQITLEELTSSRRKLPDSKEIKGPCLRKTVRLFNQMTDSVPSYEKLVWVERHVAVCIP
jgi:hypothetical protein